MIIFSILGALLVGSGIILILAKNWSSLSVTLQTVLAFLPLIAAQVLVVYMYKKDKFNRRWEEGTGLFYSITLLSCIALIGQIYHLPGEFSNYLLLCSLMILPLCYICKSKMAAMLYLAGVTGWMGSTNDFSNIFHIVFLFLLVIPYIIIENKRDSNEGLLHLLQWVFLFCLFIAWLVKLTFFDQYLIMSGLFCHLLFITAQLKFKNQEFKWLTLVRIPGFIGLLVILYVAAFAPELTEDVTNGAGNKIFMFILIILFISLSLLVISIKEWIKLPRVAFVQNLLVSWIFPSLIFVLLINIQLIKASYSIPWFLIYNLYLLGLGIVMIINGLQSSKTNLRVGILILFSWIFIRFFFSELSFLTRGVLFILMGIGFLVTNYLLIKKQDRGANDGQD